MLAAHIAGQDAGGGWMFTGEGDQPPHQNTVGHRWRTATTAAGVSGLRLHDLRHFYASGLIASGCDVVTVQRALGHSSATTTLSTYSHLWPSAEDRTRAAAQALLAEARGPEADRDGGGLHEVSVRRSCLARPGVGVDAGGGQGRGGGVLRLERSIRQRSTNGRKAEAAASRTAPTCAAVGRAMAA
jgi:hypothetical protein